jgi:hypothetical protein
LLTLIVPTPFVIAFRVNAELLIKATFPLVVFDAPKLLIAFVAPTVFNDTPPTDVNAKVEVFRVVVALSLIAPVETKLTVLPVPPEILPFKVNAPLLIVTAPVPPCESAVTVNAPVLVYDTAPLPVFVNDALPTLLLFVRLKPVADVVANELPVITLVLVALSDIEPAAAFNVTAFAAPADNAPLSVILPVVFVIETAPVPLCVIAFRPKLAFESVNEIAPAPLFEAVKFVTALAAVNNVPVADVLERVTPEIAPAPVSLTAPVVPVKETLPPVEIPPVLKVTLRAAVAVILPDAATTLALIKISLAVPVDVAKLIVLFVPVAVVVPFNKILPAPTLPVREMLPTAWREPPVSTSIAAVESAPAIG